MNGGVPDYEALRAEHEAALKRERLQTQAWRQLRQVRAEEGARLLRMVEWEDYRDIDGEEDGVRCPFCEGGTWTGAGPYGPPINKTPDPPGEPKHKDDCPLAAFFAEVKEP